MKKILIIVVCVVVGLGAWMAYRMYLEDLAVQVIFSNGKGVRVGADVYMAGVDIGDVMALDLEGDKVIVTLLIETKFRNDITDRSHFFIDSEDNLDRPAVVMVQNESPEGKPVARGMRLTGIDSIFEWKTLYYSNQARQMLNSARTQGLRERLSRIGENFKEKLSTMDWDELGHEARRQTEELSADIEEAFSSGKISEQQQRLEEKFARLRETLAHLKESEAAKKLGADLDELRRQVKQEFKRPEDEKAPGVAPEPMPGEGNEGRQAD